MLRKYGDMTTLKHSVDSNGNLVFTVDDNGKAWLQAMKDEKGDEFTSDSVMHDVFESFVANSEYDWCLPEWTGALTGAPMLATFGQVRRVDLDGVDPNRVNIAYSDAGILFYDPVEQCWAFMDYQVTSPQEQLLEKGRCVWMKG